MQRLDLIAATPSIPQGILDQDVSLPLQGGALKCLREYDVPRSFLLLLFLMQSNALIKSSSCPIEIKILLN